MEAAACFSVKILVLWTSVGLTYTLTAVRVKHIGVCTCGRIKTSAFTGVVKNLRTRTRFLLTLALTSEWVHLFTFFAGHIRTHTITESVIKYLVSRTVFHFRTLTHARV